MRITTTLALTLLLASPSFAQTGESETCFQTANTQSQLTQCAGVSYQKADDELNRIYKRIREVYKDDPAFLDKLKKSQLAWIKLRDADLAMQYPHADEPGYYGSAFPMCTSMYMTKLTRERISYLKTWLTGVEEGDVCKGSPMYDYTLQEINKH